MSVVLIVVECVSCVKLMIFDVDGVLIDGGLLFIVVGDVMKLFNLFDGYGVKLFGEVGIVIVIIMGCCLDIVVVCVKEMKIVYLFQGVENKFIVFVDLIVLFGLMVDVCGYMGDDWFDLLVMLCCGFVMVFVNVYFEVIVCVYWVVEVCGGYGVVCEVCDVILCVQCCYDVLFVVVCGV